jgi:membrane protein
MIGLVAKTANGTFDVVTDVFDAFREENVSFMAGSIAYSAFVSVLPLIVLTVVVAAAIGGEDLVNQVVGLVETYLTPTGKELLVDTLTENASRANLSVISALVLVWGTLKVFRGLDIAFSSLYGTRPSNSIKDQLVDGMIVLVTSALAVGAVVVLTAGSAVLEGSPIVKLLSPVFLIAYLTIILLPVYYFFPDTDVSLSSVLPGTLVASVGWAVLQAGFSIYLTVSSSQELYGILGVILLLITWFYFSASLVLLGATTNVVLSERHRSQRQSGDQSAVHTD